jgi:hypothetical protein
MQRGIAKHNTPQKTSIQKEHTTPALHFQVKTACVAHAHDDLACTKSAPHLDISMISNLESQRVTTCSTEFEKQ